MRSYAAFCQEIAPVIRYEHELGFTCYDDSLFVRKVDKFFAQPPENKGNPKLKTKADLLNASFIIGENHYHITPKRTLIDNMSTLKKAGFNILFMEHLFYDYQQDLDDFFNGGGISDSLWSLLKKYDEGFCPFFTDMQEALWEKYNFTQILLAAQEAGIRVVGLDVMNVYRLQENELRREGSSGPFLCNNRISAMNFTAYHIIERETDRFNKRWCALMGSAHVKQFEGTLGVADLTGARALYAFDHFAKHRKSLASLSLNSQQLAELSIERINADYVLPVSRHPWQAQSAHTYNADLLILRHPELPTTIRPAVANAYKNHSLFREKKLNAETKECIKNIISGKTHKI